MCVEFFAQKIEDLTCLCWINIKQNLARKLYPTLKPSNLKEMSYLNSFLRTTGQMSTPFLRD